jgi:histidinol dehydrogenase
MNIVDLRSEDILNFDKYTGVNLESNIEIEIKVAEIIENVRKYGDEKIKEYTLAFDGVDFENIRVAEEEVEEAYKIIDEDFIEIVKEASGNIKEFHKNQLPSDFEINRGEGIYLGQLIKPMKRVALYVPGGKAAYPSTVLMNGIPAVIAGVSEIVLVSPPDKQGNMNPYVLVAADMLGINEIYKIGGAQGVAALAYGTETINKVNKIVGPGNVFVATAKKQVYGAVDIDMIAGPSEVLVIADDTSNPKYIAADLMAQGEHDELASMYVVTTDPSLPERINTEISKQIENIDKKAILDKSIEDNLYYFIVNDIEECFKVSNEIAPEHLEISLENPKEYLKFVENAGSIFLGEYTPEALGDYFAGTNHTLPTSGTAKFSSPLGVYDFIKRPSYLYYDEKALGSVYKKIAKFASYEGLTAHKRSVEVRYE